MSVFYLPKICTMAPRSLAQNCFKVEPRSTCMSLRPQGSKCPNTRYLPKTTVSVLAIETEAKLHVWYFAPFGRAAWDN